MPPGPSGPEHLGSVDTCRPGRPAFRGALDAFDDLLAAVPVRDRARADLRRRMAAPGRRYHGPHHLALLWARHLALGRGSGFHEPRVARLVASAIAFHDAVREPGRADNESASAALWREAAAAGGAMPAEEVEWVAGTIEATADHLAAAEATLAEADAGAARPLLARARLWVLDLDLSPLGEAPAAFARNTGLLRLERPDLDEGAWSRCVRAFLARIHAAPRLYRTRAVRAAFEARAKANIARALSTLRTT